MDKNINITLKVWRQKGPKEKGAFETYQLKDISQGSSFLEMLDVLNEQLVNEGREPVFFDHDCREGICGMCSLYINGHPHGPDSAITTCQLHMRKFHDGETITIEPWRSAGFPIIRDLTVDRQAYDKIMQAGGFVSVNTGGVPDANAIPDPEEGCRPRNGCRCLYRLWRLRCRLQERIGHALRIGQGQSVGTPPTGKS